MSKTKTSQTISLFGEFDVAKKSSKPEVSFEISSSRNSSQNEFASTKDLLKKYQVVATNKHIAHEFQSFGCHLAEVLADKQHTSLYIKLAKTLPRGILERALSFVIDSTADNKAKLFMWKLQQLKTELEMNK